MDLIQLTEQARAAVTELLGAAKLSPGDLFVVGCSSSEVGGEKIGSHSSPEIAKAVLDGILPVLRDADLFLAAQCCEHLNRALIVEEEALRAYRLDRVNVVPQPKAGGSFATAAWAAFSHPAAVERIGCAAAGIDIGQTLIGMHLRPVAVPASPAPAPVPNSSAARAPSTTPPCCNGSASPGPVPFLPPSGRP